MDCCNIMIIVERGKNMFEHVDTQKKTDDFERRITKIYNKYAEKDIAEEYMELWNGFVELIQYIQNQNTIDNMSPMEMIKLLKEIGMTETDIKELFLQQMKVN